MTPAAGRRHAPERVRPPLRTLALGLFGLAACLALGAPAGEAGPQLSPERDDRFAGLQWTFARVRYQSWAAAAAQYRRDYWTDPWAVDAPAAEQNLSRRLASVTSIQVNDPVVVEIGDEDLWEYPWLYFVEPGTLRFRDDEVEVLREFLLRGGTATFDDFHGPIEWANFEREIKRVFPEREIVDLEPPHPIYTCFYQIAAYPQIPGLGSYFAGRTWEKGGFTPHLRAINDDSGRAMVIINFNTDMGDGWEWSNATEYPGYLRYTAEAYRMGINQVVYSLTH